MQVWAGLRGAVGLSLSLFVLLDNSIEDLRYRTLSFFFMGMMVSGVSNLLHLPDAPDSDTVMNMTIANTLGAPSYLACTGGCRCQTLLLALVSHALLHQS